MKSNNPSGFSVLQRDLFILVEYFFKGCCWHTLILLQFLNKYLCGIISIYNLRIYFKYFYTVCVYRHINVSKGAELEAPLSQHCKNMSVIPNPAAHSSCYRIDQWEKRAFFKRKGNPWAWITHMASNLFFILGLDITVTWQLTIDRRWILLPCRQIKELAGETIFFKAWLYPLSCGLAFKGRETFSHGLLL